MREGKLIYSPAHNHLTRSIFSPFVNALILWLIKKKKIFFIKFFVPLDDKQNFITVINENKQQEDLKQITEDNLENECRELMRIGLNERSLKILGNFPEELIDKKLKFVNLKIELLWRIGLFQDWKAYR